MKLGVKMFFYITIFFSAAFLSCGAALISYFYDTAIEKEIDSTGQLYQYNKYVMQAALITRNDQWISDVIDGISGMDFIVSDLNGTVALFAPDGTMLYSGFPDDTDFSSFTDYFTGNKKSTKANYQFMKIKSRMHLLIYGSVMQKDTGVYLITGVDIQKLLMQLEQMIQKFGYIYAAALSAGILLILGLSALLTRPIKQLTTASQRIADGNYSERVTEYGSDEVGQLARNFNQMAYAIEEKIEELSAGARQKEDFAANLAHELKTPLTSVIGYADRIYQKDLPRELQKQAAWQIWNEGMRLEALSEKLMDLTVLNHKEFELQELDALQMLQELADDIEYLMKEKNVFFHYTAQPAYVRAEYDLFKTLFLNLIDNAIKAGATQIHVTGTVEKNKHADEYIQPDYMKSSKAGKYRNAYAVHFEDNGCGIPPNEIKRITEAFYMIDKSRSRKLHGAGLGLSLAQKIAEIHGSSLIFESDGKSGTKVTVHLNLS